VIEAQERQGPLVAGRLFVGSLKERKSTCSVRLAFEATDLAKLRRRMRGMKVPVPLPGIHFPAYQPIRPGVRRGHDADRNCRRTRG
jgi:hypothetical protein